MQTLCRYHADYDISVHLAHFFFLIRQVCTRSICDLIHTLCRLVKTFADLVQTIIQHILVFFWHNVLLSYAKYAHGNFLTKLWFLQDLLGVKGAAPCWLLLGASTGHEAGRPRAVWLIRSSAISGEGRSRHTGWLVLCMVVIVMAIRRGRAAGHWQHCGRLYYISSWAMCWPTNHPKKPVTGWVECAPSLQSLHLAHLVHTLRSASGIVMQTWCRKWHT